MSCCCKSLTVFKKANEKEILVSILMSRRQKLFLAPGFSVANVTVTAKESLNCFGMISLSAMPISETAVVCQATLRFRSFRVYVFYDFSTKPNNYRSYCN